MIIKIDEVKDFLRIDYDDDNQFLELLIINAEDYLKDAVDDFEIKLKEDKAGRFKNKAKLVMLTLITNWYDTRDYTEINSSEKVRYTIWSLIQQMKHGYESD